eukprot:1158573-Pelagomonas_calceolata.AAC.7
MPFRAIVRRPRAVLKAPPDPGAEPSNPEDEVTPSIWREKYNSKSRNLCETNHLRKVQQQRWKAA